MASASQGRLFYGDHNCDWPLPNVFLPMRPVGNPSKFRRRMCHMWTTCDTHACGQKSPENLIEFYLINACGKHVGSMWTRVGNWS